MTTEPLSPEILVRLSALSTCMVANAIEGVDARLRNVGFGNSTIQCRFPQLRPVVGYAVTLRLHGANPPMEGGIYVDRADWWDDVLDTPPPRIVVIEDADHHVGTAAFIGEVHAAILHALGCLAVVTNGAVRDLDQIERLGFQLFSGNVSVSHAYAHVARVDSPVEVAGLTIAPGDLLHGDRHGILKVPAEQAEKILEIATRLQRHEREILRFCESDHFSPGGLRKLLGKMA